MPKRQEDLGVTVPTALEVPHLQPQHITKVWRAWVLELDSSPSKLSGQRKVASELWRAVCVNEEEKMYPSTLCSWVNRHTVAPTLFSYCVPWYTIERWGDIIWFYLAWLSKFLFLVAPFWGQANLYSPYTPQFSWWTLWVTQAEWIIEAPLKQTLQIPTALKRNKDDKKPTNRIKLGRENRKTPQG